MSSCNTLEELSISLVIKILNSFSKVEVSSLIPRLNALLLLKKKIRSCTINVMDFSYKNGI